MIKNHLEHIRLLIFNVILIFSITSEAKTMVGYMVNPFTDTKSEYIYNKGEARTEEQGFYNTGKNLPYFKIQQISENELILVFSQSVWQYRDTTVKVRFDKKKMLNTRIKNCDKYEDKSICTIKESGRNPQWTSFYTSDQFFIDEFISQMNDSNSVMIQVNDKDIVTYELEGSNEALNKQSLLLNNNG